MRETYLAKLRATSDEANLRHQEDAKTKQHHADTRVLCDKPLADQIESLMSSLPPVQRNRPWSMEELLVRLQGRYTARPHAMNIGKALRAMGWVSSRDWTRDGGGRRVWLHPI